MNSDLVIYLIHLFKKARIVPETPVVWTITLIFAGVFIIPVYWYLFIWQ